MWFVWLICGGVVGYAIGYAEAKKGRAPVGISSSQQAQGTQSLNQGQTEEKQRRLNAIEEYLRSHEQVTNQEIAKMFGVDDSTAERYFDELEKQGKLVQVGRTGQAVTYKRQ